MSFRWFQHDNGARGALLARLVFLIALQVACQAGAYDPSVLEGAYLRVQAALADDKLEGVAADSRVIAAEAQKLGKDGAAMDRSAQALGTAGDLGAARVAFGELSDAIVAHVRPDGSGGLRLAYCPMVRKSWLQTGDTIRNPYYGHQMLSCGEFKQ